MKIILIFLLGVSAMAVDSADLVTFRKNREESLKKNWLVVSGLTWLKEGENTLGADVASDVDLPAPVPKNLGKIYFKNKKASIEFSAARFDGVIVTVDGKNISAGKKYPLSTDKEKSVTTVEVGGVSFYLIDRPNGVGVRVKDPNAETLKNFKGLSWWPENKKMSVVGKWKALSPAKTLRVPDIHGNTNEEVIHGSVVFSIDGRQMELFPTRENDDLFFVFKDLTTGKSSYGTGRFLTSTVNSDGSVVVDFNRAYNPPCAQIKFATCPMAPPENALKVAIEAGEKAPPKH